MKFLWRRRGGREMDGESFHSLMEIWRLSQESGEQTGRRASGCDADMTGAPEWRRSVRDVPCGQKHPGSRAPTDLSLGGQGRKRGVSWNRWGLSSKAEHSHNSHSWKPSASPTLAFPVYSFLHWGIEWYTSVAATAKYVDFTKKRYLLS